MKNAMHGQAEEEQVWKWGTRRRLGAGKRGRVSLPYDEESPGERER